MGNSDNWLAWSYARGMSTSDEDQGLNEGRLS